VTQLELVALVVRECEPAIDFFVNVLQFELVEDAPSLTNDGRPKRWVVVRPGAESPDAKRSVSNYGAGGHQGAGPADAAWPA
jgi:catechol 2,3-dioxygenase-like lactoylglutathione lyase family enzyme